MIRTLLIIVIAAALAPAGAQGVPATRQAVRVAAASDLNVVLDAVIVRLAVLEPSIDVEAVYASSGTLHAQLRQRAPYDLFLSADLDYPRDLVSRGIGAERDLFTYATGHLAVWVPHDSSLRVEREGLAALDGARRIAIANPRHAPYGRAAEAALRATGVWDRVRSRLVLGENVAQAAQFAQSGAADAAVIARSLTMSPAMRDSGRFWSVPADTHPPLLQGGVILPWARSRAAAERFRDFLLGEEGRELLASSGFGLAPR